MTTSRTRLAGLLTFCLGASQPLLAQSVWTPAGITADVGTESTAAQAGKKGKKKGIEWFWVPHPGFKIGKQVRVEFKAKFMHEELRSDTGEGDLSSLDVARRRIGVEGRVFQAVSFQVEHEFVGNQVWRDVYADYDQFTFARLQAGRFKLPFSIDENTSATNLDFVFRSLAASELAPGRDRGVMFHGQVFNHLVGYEIGRFEHDGWNAHTNNPDRVTGGPTTAWRVTSQPFRGVRSKWTDVEFGYASTTSDLLEGFSSIKGQTALGLDFYKNHFLVTGARRRTGFELRIRPGPFSAKAEYIRVTEERRGESVEDTDLSPLVSSGWYVSGTWAITGETKSNGLDEPIRPLLQGGFGAVEAAARIEELSFGSEASFAFPDEPGSTSRRADVVLGNTNRVLTFGVNWYPNRWIKIQFNVIRETMTDPAQGPLPGQSSFWSRAFRLQVGF